VPAGISDDPQAMQAPRLQVADALPALTGRVVAVGTLIEPARTLAVPSRAAVTAELPPAPSEACPVGNGPGPEGATRNPGRAVPDQEQSARAAFATAVRVYRDRGVNFNTLPLRGVLWTVPMSS
jgi:hypothetical protein